MLRAATLPAAMARMTVAGPVWQSPPTNTLSYPAAAKPSSASKQPRTVSMPNSSNGSVSMPCPTAMSTMSAAMRSCGLSAATGAGRPARTAPIIWGCVASAVQRPSPSTSMPTGACSTTNSTPSATALSTSAGSAVMSSLRRRYTTDTSSAPARTAVRAQSMATLPPPTTATLLPVKSG